MDIFSHALWGGVGFGRANKTHFYWALLFGALPDLLSFGVHTIALLLGITPAVSWESGPPPMSAIPAYVHTLYNISHSLVVFTIASICIWFLFRRLFVPFMAYGFAVFIDIPTHSTDFFPTPFLWPISDFTIDGINWGQPYIFFPNTALLGSVYIWWLWQRKKKRTVSTQQTL